jgi:hypothetical protein
MEITDTLELTPIISTLFAVILSLLIELVPPLARVWEHVTQENKRAIRGWVGLVLAGALGLLHYFTALDLGLGDTFDIYTLMGLGSSWVLFIFGGEATYQTVNPFLPRKRRERELIAQLLAGEVSEQEALDAWDRYLKGRKDPDTHQ